MPQPLKQLRTFDAVVKKLGGTGGLGRLVEQDSAAVCNWKRRRGLFPSKYYLKLQRELAARGATAPTKLFGFYEG